MGNIRMKDKYVDSRLTENYLGSTKFNKQRIASHEIMEFTIESFMES